jgi:RHS repeat-associated protein
MFDLLVNGGGQLILTLSKSGYMVIQRRVNAPWNDSTTMADVVLVPLDASVSAVSFNSPNLQVASGSIVTDKDGTRQARLFFQPGTTAQMTLPNGTTTQLAWTSLHLTEYTAGPLGPESMPADLPATTAYTYAVEFTAEEAAAVGAKSVQLSSPASLYVENFLGFPTGTVVPKGSYDKDQGCWVPEANGVVIQIIGVVAGLAVLAVDGSGLAASAATLATLGATDPERAQLAGTYPVGARLWRVPITHFTAAADCNFPYAPDFGGSGGGGGSGGAGGSGGTGGTGGTGGLGGSGGDDDSPCTGGSIVEVTNQILGESLPVAGTPYHLSYRSNRAPGGGQYQVTIPISGPSVGSTTKRFDLELRIAGRFFQQSFPAAPNQNYLFTWDGLDAYGRRLQGRQTAVVRVGRVVPARYTGVPYQTVAGFQAANMFEQYNADGQVLTADSDRIEFTLWTQATHLLGIMNSLEQDVGGWTVDTHHQYDVQSRALYLGDGTRRTSDFVGSSIDYFAAGSTSPLDGAVPARQGFLSEPKGTAVGPDGSVYIADYTQVKQVDPKTGLLNSIVGGNCGSGGHGLTQAQTSCTTGVFADVAVTCDNQLVIAERRFNDGVIWRLGPDGKLQLVAGGQSPTTFTNCAYEGDGGPANQARLCRIVGIAAGKDCVIYTLEAGTSFTGGRVRAISTDGTIRTIATGVEVGTELISFLGGIEVGRDGSVYYADSWHFSVHQIAPDGSNRVVAGIEGQPGYAGDGGLAIAAKLVHPQDIAIGPDGALFISDRDQAVIREVTPDGIINTIAGSPGGLQGVPLGIGGPLGQTKFAGSFGIPLSAGPDGSLYITYADGSPEPNASNAGLDGVYRVAPVIVGPVSLANILVPSADGAEVYEFTRQGRHLRTRHALTGGILRTFGYDSAGRLASITDGDSNVTTVQRDSAGAPTSIVGPYGHVTTFLTDSNGFLSKVVDPSSAETDFVYTASGLLTTMVDARGGAHLFDWDGLGHLTRDENPAGGFKSFSRTEAGAVRTVTRTTAGGTVASYKTEQLPTGQRKRTFAVDIATPTVATFDANSETTVETQPDGMQISTTLGPAPRWGMAAPLLRNGATKTPAGLSLLTGDAQTVALSNASDPFSVSTLIDSAAANGQTSTTFFQGTTRTETFTSPAGRATSATLDTLGRPLQAKIAGLAPVAFVYDARGRLATTTQATRTTTRGYDSQGNLQSITDALLQTETFDHDPLGRVTARHRADGTVVGIGYDAMGNCTTVTPPGKPAHLFTYTPDNQMETYAAPDVGFGPAVTGYQYDLDGHLIAVTRPGGATVGMSYDPSGRMQSVTLPAGAMSLGYSTITGKLTSATGPYGVNLAYVYDGRLLKSTTWSGTVAGSVTRTFDSFFRVSTETVNGLATTKATLGYDNDGLVTSVATPTGSISLTYDPAASRLMTTAVGAVTDSRTYDQFGQIQSYYAAFGTSDLFNVSYSRDALGRLQQKTETMQGVSKLTEFGYDQAGRLIAVAENGATVRSYLYDDNGNRTTFDDIERGATTTGTYDAQDRLRTYGTLTYTYTHNGELRTKTDTSSGQVTTYTYDALGSLTHVDLPDGRAIDYIVDGAGRRVGKKINGTLVQGWLYRDGLRPVAELNGAGAVVSRFVYGTRPNVPEYMIKGGVTYRIVLDHLGSPRMVVDSGTGSVAERVDRDEFGVVASDTNPGMTPFGFAGGLVDQDTALIRFGARDYDPQIGRWTVKDPIVFSAGQWNFYQYIGSDPVNEVDVNGLSKTDKYFGLPKQFWNWFHRVVKQPGDPDLCKKEADELYKWWKDLGQPGPDNKGPWDLFEWVLPFPWFLDPCQVDPLLCGPETA